MNHPLQPFRLPTVAGCPYRDPIASEVISETDDTETADRPVARCRLVRAVTGVAEASRSEVNSNTCKSCCQSFPPSHQQWNPIVASLIYRIAGEVRQQGGVPGCDVEHAERLRQRAMKSLDVVHGARSRIEPARGQRACIYQGDAIRSSPGNTLPVFPAFECRHPGHARASEERCQICPDWSSEQPISRALTLPEIVPPFGRRSGSPVKHWAVGITSAPRRQPTLEACIQSVRRAGWSEPHLFIDGPVRLPESTSHLRMTWRDQPLGVWRNWYMALAELVMLHPEADAIMMLQDDAYLHDRGPLRNYLESCLWPGERPGIVSLYYPGQMDQPGWQRFPETWRSGPVAMVFPTALAKAFLADATINVERWKKTDPNWISFDALISRWAARSGVAVWHPTPSLVQHLGNTSTLWDDAGNQGYRRAALFSGGIDTPFAEGERFEDFPENLFPAASESRQRYRDGIQTGRERMAESKATICGIARTVRNWLPRFARRVEKLGAQFADYRVILFENDSIDLTGEFLADWSHSNPKVTLLRQQLSTRHFPSVRSLDRARQLAACRNRYVNALREQNFKGSHVIVVDTDLGGGWSYDGIAHTFGQDDWDFVGSQGLLRRPRSRGQHSPYIHFDSWAYRPLEGTAPPSSGFADWILERGTPLIPVRSCFGGLGVYRSECFEVAEYAGEDQEHVELHDAMTASGVGRCFLNPSQVVLYTS